MTRSRSRMLMAGAAVLVALGVAATALSKPAQAGPTVTVYLTPT